MLGAARFSPSTVATDCRTAPNLSGRFAVALWEAKLDGCLGS